jgi:hypothetical protein
MEKDFMCGDVKQMQVGEKFAGEPGCGQADE